MTTKELSVAIEAIKKVDEGRFWESAVTQQLIVGWFNLAVLVISLAVGLSMLCVAWRWLRSSDRQRKEASEVLYFVSAFPFGVFALALVAFALIGVYCLLNPEYMALSRINLEF